EGTPGEADEVDLIARLVVLGEQLVSLADAVVDAEADAAFYELQRLALLRVDALHVMRDLLDALGVGGGDDLMQLADVGEDRTRPVVVPCAVEAQDHALHDNTPPTDCTAGTAPHRRCGTIAWRATSHCRLLRH